VKSGLIRNIRRLLFNKHAENTVVSSVILAGAVIALGLATLNWTYQKSLIANDEYADVTEANLASIKEKLVFEYIFYNSSENELTVYLMNCGKSNDVSLASVYLSNSSWVQSFSDIELRFLNGTLTQGLDIGEEGYFQISVSLVANTTYSLRIVTGRGRSFDTTFIP